MALYIGVPDGLIAHKEALILAKGGCGPVFRFLDPDLLHFLPVQAVAVVHHMPAHQVLDGLLVQSLLGHGIDLLQAVALRCRGGFRRRGWFGRQNRLRRRIRGGVRCRFQDRLHHRYRRRL